MFMPHPTMSSDEMRARTQGVWDEFLQLARNLETLRLYADTARSLGVCFYLEAVSANVCEHRHRNR